jgi:3-isopropylmalate/(R)-2-methylmalate dehydratase small subunit
MNMAAFTQIRSRTVVLPHANIDTDRIIPARFLTTTTRTGLGRLAFHDWRYRNDGTPDPDFELNKPAAQGCQILVGGHNFGCGSSREHAPWALLDYGFRAVLSSQIADIFRNNALNNGLLAIQISEAEHDFLLHHPGIELAIHLITCEIELPDGGRFQFAIDDFARYCLLEGVDTLGYLLRQAPAITAYEESHA